MAQSYLVLTAVALLILLSSGSMAQLSSHNTQGDLGLMSGTQAPVGMYGVGMLYGYSAYTLRDKNGDSFRATTEGVSVDVRAAVAGLLWTTEFTMLGGNYGFAVYPALTNNAVELPPLQTDTETRTGLADTYIQPLRTLPFSPDGRGRGHSAWKLKNPLWISHF